MAGMGDVEALVFLCDRSAIKPGRLMAGCSQGLKLTPVDFKIIFTMA